MPRCQNKYHRIIALIDHKQSQRSSTFSWQEVTFTSGYIWAMGVGVFCYAVRLWIHLNIAYWYLHMDLMFWPSFFDDDLPIIIGANFNLAVDCVGRSGDSLRTTQQATSSKIFKTFIADLNIVQSWWILNLNIRDYTYLSWHHKYIWPLSCYTNWTKSVVIKNQKQKAHSQYVNTFYLTL